MEVSETQRLKQMEDETRRLKPIGGRAESARRGAEGSDPKKTAGACRTEDRSLSRRSTVERTHGLQAAGRGAVQLSIRAKAGAQRSVAR
jgi:hypothetical protein